MFNRKERKLNSILAGEASAKFSVLLGDIGAFDSRLCHLPNKKLVIDYFRWRSEDAHRNALNGHCYWALRKEGETENTTTQALSGMSMASKNELLFQKGINFNNLPVWQKRGVGIYWQEYKKQALNPKTQQTVYATRNKIFVDYNLPMKEEYDKFLSNLVR